MGNETAAPIDGRSTRWETHRRERRSTIVAAAIAAIEAHGPDVLTAQIAELAAVPRTHVYRHFDDKHALDLAVSSAIGAQIAERIRVALASRGSVRAIVSTSIDEHLSWIEQHPNLYRFLAQHAYAIRVGRHTSAVDAKAAFAAELTTLIRRYLEVLGADTSGAERIIVGLVGLVDATAAWWLETGIPDRSVLTAELTDHVWVLLDRSARRLGLVLDPDEPLPRLRPLVS
ncbi:TetR family transcriptional regulator [uncultured Jatrophihabitans sp.]|uniref:TetR family transcriptional regulator n=1 Tax=uncultured Jatrophihabitans sp. TaxID=1610747 RepID=UPI0035CAA19B